MGFNFLKYLRWVLAMLVGGIILIFFIDIRNSLPNSLHSILHIQVVPLILGGSLIAIAVITILTLLFGRIYCSVLCPLGILQDVVLRIKKWWYKLRKQKKKLHTEYSLPSNILRYSILAIVGICLVAGFTMPLLWLDPYSFFGRVVTSLVKPVIVWFNNIGADVLNSMDNYSLYRITLESTTYIVAISSAVILAAIIAAVWLRERIVCNTVCPVGALLSLLSKFSLFGITINNNCTHCKQCERSCKSNCIDSKGVYVDKSRCVTCFDCLDKCKFNAIGFSPTGWRLGHKAKTEVKADVEIKSDGLARRRFIHGSTISIATFAASKVLADVAGEREPDDPYYVPEKILPLPPGAGSIARFLDKCTACQLCISRCPTKVLQPAFLENGLTGMMTPVMKFRVKSFCSYDCIICSEICPNHAILPLLPEDKKLIRVGNVALFLEHCVVIESDQDCGACAEHCPTQAVSMVPYENTGLTKPVIKPEICIGCGACQSICPQVPAAIRIAGVTVQEKADPPSVDVMKDVEINDFGF